ncbi:cobalt-precorrin-5B (C(1))-methyltransferase CbiD [Helicovermis profundi]|uniref:Cobalt-precorrin-5B C(1)-methyltransferase n=1 Tax=Helicovermis profundi TaxID=3065157 RepID=A0AAU9E8I3_9FIRM|nr:cobalt-precorrin-5B (C(1))-methyltransferase CbiD [Clostridia bacterium S502]
MERYIEKNGKKLKYGYTTGSSATAASKASAIMLLNRENVNTVKIDTPKGWPLTIDIYNQEINDDYALCSVIKDGGDDPDMTNKMTIFSKISFRDDKEINIYGGIGIGKVTKEGLSIKPGNSAINPVPLRTIEKEVRSVIGENRGANVEIYAPDGENIAKKTFNPKLGIVGGISIIGTSGIVEPMSEDALIETLKIEMRIFKKKHYDKILLISPGNYGRDFSRKMGLNIEEIIKCSNYVGQVIDEALKLDIKKILWVGHAGKMVKIAGGIFNTHSKIADGRMEIIMSQLALIGAETDLIKLISISNTTDEAFKYIKEYKMDKVFDNISNKISEKLNKRAFDEIQNGVVLFTNEHGLLSVSDLGNKIMEEFNIEQI